MTDSSTSPAGEPAKCVSMTSPTLGSRSWRARFISAALLAARNTPTATCTQVVRRWWRLAATASGSTGPTRSIRHGTTSSILTVYQALRSWPTRTRAAVSSWQRITGSAFRMDTALIRSDLRAVTARRIRSVIHRFKFDRNGLDAYRALVGCHRVRSLLRDQPRNGMAARRFSRANGKEFARPRASTLATDARPFTSNVGGDPSLRFAGRSRRMATTDPDRR